MVRFRFCNKYFIKNLREKGVVLRKSNIIELPNYDARELDLAFLLGYFDGDGTTGTSKITSGSKIFLEQIKDKYCISSKIHSKTSYGKSYDLYLGAKLFNEMLDNYKDSLKRKRIRFISEEERIQRIKHSTYNNGNLKKFTINNPFLANLVWKIPKTKIAEIYGVSDSLIGKYCRKWKIKSPSRGYWVRKRYIELEDKNNIG
ncbi:MAG: hypothetical protein EU533_06675 [Promethearchaeota archaeon]|nr:MAG: hypothetical protein EU533_06675 [Candidatus Lokiarchaeota archaeon]